MLQINRQKKGEDFIIVTNKTGSTKAEISLDKVCSISNLFINNKQIITDQASLDYEKTYASSIMFPFANRINNGKYTFMGGEFQLHCNEKESNNALHGLIYNKKRRTNSCESILQFSDCDRSRTYNRWSRNPVLYPIELRSPIY